VVARHGHKLITKSTIASVIYQGAEVAAVVLTGGAASVGAYYALQYGFYGLGLVMNLELLGVSRELELQADQLGIQYGRASEGIRIRASNCLFRCCNRTATMPLGVISILYV
jgi:Zn-dependent protease with chaperone function